MKRAVKLEFPIGEKGEWFLGADGDVYEAVSQSALNERAEAMYRDWGPFVKLTPDALFWLRERLSSEERVRADAAERELAEWKQKLVDLIADEVRR